MELIDERIERYAFEHSTAPSEQMAALHEQARAALPYPQMLSGPVVGRLLELLVRSLRAELVLEIGTYAGYSALAMAEGLGPGGRLITCEISPEHAAFAQRQFDASPYGERIELHLGPAHETIAGLDGPFDFVFIDADKTGYLDYYEAVLPKLSAPGLIAADNTLRGGAVLEAADHDEDAGTAAIVAFNRALAADERIVCAMLTVRDGITLISKR
jgi:predicted O-methyltransferase YrrM